MITNESEIRVALQAGLASVLALDGYWGWAIMVLFILMPWKPIFLVIGYLAQPVVDWRMRKAQRSHDKGVAQIEQELNYLLGRPGVAPEAFALATTMPAARPRKTFAPFPPARSIDPVEINCPKAPAVQLLSEAPQDAAALRELLPVIKDHIRSLIDSILQDMKWEVERVESQGEIAEAWVKFQSPTVAELVIRQRFALRKRGRQWFVHTRRSGGAVGMPPPATPIDRTPLQLA